MTIESLSVAGFPTAVEAFATNVPGVPVLVAVPAVVGVPVGWFSCRC
jgi:hypothetical protein